MKPSSHILAALGRAAEQMWLLLGLLGAWWLVSANSTSPFFPPLQRILETIWTGFTAGPLPGYTLFSLGNLAAGLALAIVAGVGAGLVLGLLPHLNRVLDPVLQFLRASPQVALIPLIIGALGIDALPKIYSIALGCFWPILLNTIDGVAGIDRAQMELAQAYRIPVGLRLRRIMLPAAAPQIVAGIRVALAIGIVVMVVSEIYGSVSGLGYYILTSSRSFDVPRTWGGTLLVAAIGYLLSTGFVLAERMLLPWYFKSAQRQGTSRA